MIDFSRNIAINSHTMRFPYVDVKEHLPVMVSSIILVVIALLLLNITIKQNYGRIVYALDDPYIHMAMAKNFSQHGIWGITKYGFTSSSSSIFWTLLLSLTYLISGANEISPFVLNVILSILFIFITYTILRRHKAPILLIYVILTAVLLFTPMPALIFCGQEHVLHILIATIFAYSASKLITTSDNQKTRIGYSATMVLACLLSPVRYEGLLMVFVVSVILLLKRRFVSGLLIGMASLLPMIIYGIISFSQGWFFLPNPVILKGSAPDFSALRGIIRFFGYSTIATLFHNPHILALLLISLVCSFTLHKHQNKTPDTNFFFIMNIVFIATTILHAQFAGMGWFYRYEAYLVTLGIIIQGLSLNELGKIETFRHLITKSKNLIVLLPALLLLLLPLFVRAVKSLIEIPHATHERYMEHVLPGIFLKDYPCNSPVVVNDIGAISFYSDAKILDMYGLGNIEPVIFRKDSYDKSDLSAWAEQEEAKLAYLQVQWREVFPRVPDEWKVVEKWQMRKNVVFGDTIFLWYCINPEHKQQLMIDLQEFSEILPKDIELVITPIP